MSVINFTHPTLFKKSKTGAVIYCSIFVAGKEITVKTGQRGTDKPTFHYTTCEPKNVGKSNETTAEQQALIEAEAKWIKKQKEGYALDASGESNVRLPMKVKVYQDQLKNVDFPCYTSPKLNGVNYTVRIDELGRLAAYSRGGEPYHIFPHQEKGIRILMERAMLLELNGEQYIHNTHLQDIQAAVTKPNELTQNLVFHVFDIPSHGEHPYSERLKSMEIAQEFVKDEHFVTFVLVRRNVPDHETIRRHFLQDIASGYEGTVIRNASGLYVHNQRSSDVFKYKEAQDAEFKVIDFKLDKHRHAVFQCQSEGGPFWVKPKGTAEERLQMGDRADQYIGQWLKVEFETLSKAGKPTKPVGICFRQCDSEGNPLE